jgi:uracil-DNA glycosylase
MNIPNWNNIPQTLRDAIIKDIDEICPKPELIFRAFEETNLDDVKVVILGQDPYHTPGKARGVAFGYHPNYKGRIDSSLQNIFKEVVRDYYQYRTEDYNMVKSLENWTKQGVLLLNTRLTVLEGKPLSHKDIGWEEVIINFIKELDNHTKDKVYMLWGKEAQSYAEHIRQDENYILETSHPCKFSAHRGFNGCGNFTAANRYLQAAGRGEIKW